MVKNINIFVSYAHRNKKAVSDLLDRMSDHLGVMKGYKVNLWVDTSLKEGELWEEQIKDKIKECDVAILMLSPAFLNSKYIMEKEVPLILELNKSIIPVAVARLDHSFHDFKGLDKYQYYKLDKEGFSEPRSYNEIQSDDSLDLFALEVSKIVKRKIEEKVNK